MCEAKRKKSVVNADRDNTQTVLPATLRESLPFPSKSEAHNALGRKPA